MRGAKVVLAGIVLSSLAACGSPQLTAPQTGVRPQAQATQPGFKTQWWGRGFGWGGWGRGLWGFGGLGFGGLGFGGFGYPFYGGLYGLGVGYPFYGLGYGFGGYGLGCGLGCGYGGLYW